MHGNLDLDPNLLVEREVSLIGCHAFKDELPEAISLLARCAGRARALVEAEIGLDDVPEAYRRLIAGETRGPQDDHPAVSLISARRPAASNR